MMKLFFIFILLNFSFYASAQNLIPNGSFEEFTECPEGLADLTSKCIGWFDTRGTCDYYNACDDPCDVSVPCNVGGWQEALTGLAYAGFVSVDLPNNSGYREHMSTTLTQALTIGETYFFSMYVNSGFVLEQSPNKASNGQGAWFTTVEHSSIWDSNPIDNPSPILNDPQIINLEVINDSTNWVQVKGSFIADSAYTYIVLGGFLDEDNLEVINATGEGPFVTNGEAYYFVDEVRLSADSVFAYEDLVTSVYELTRPEISIYPNPIADVIHIRSDGFIESIELFDQSGRIVLHQSVGRVGASIEVHNLTFGIYSMQIRFKNGQRAHERVVKYY